MIAETSSGGVPGGSLAAVGVRRRRIASVRSASAPATRGYRCQFAFDFDQQGHLIARGAAALRPAGSAEPASPLAAQVPRPSARTARPAAGAVGPPPKPADLTLDRAATTC